MANEMDLTNDEVQKIETTLQSLLSKQADIQKAQRQYEQDLNNKYQIDSINKISELINQRKSKNTELDEFSDDEEFNQTSDNNPLNSLDDDGLQRIIDEHYNAMIEYKKQLEEVTNEILQAQKNQQVAKEKLEELYKRRNFHENEVEKNNSSNIDRIEMSSSSPNKARISTNQIHAAHDCLGKGFILDTDQDSIFLRNTTTSHPTGFKITDEKMTAVNKQPLDAQACEKMLQAGKELYGNKLVVYAPTEAEKKHMEEAAKKLNIECTVTTSKEEHQRLMDEHAKKMEAPKIETKATQQTANNAEKVNAKKPDTPNQNVKNPLEVIEASQSTNDNEDTEDSRPSFQSRL